MEDSKELKRTGLSHLVLSFGYSMSGARYLAREPAARHEALMLLMATVLFLLVQAETTDYVMLAALFILVVCVEAINTAGELIVDRVSPEISDFAKKAKDLLSFAVFCSLLLFVGFALSVVLEPAINDLESSKDMPRSFPAETHKDLSNPDHK